ncbi:MULTISPECIES: c-type cytochrome [Thiomicrorhabdus]|uniref:Cytochrome c n=1 Tax=Thiomicrorhabdus heinhorstiae TaxID=2748010 RepID=A0ABS0C0J1_9GAMM|nr:MULTISPECIES: cytochrome c [Thiomicrorhabdus]MBF6058769.1 cytochrome c [Thiomicrorhabdus heinhorstiae]
MLETLGLYPSWYVPVIGSAWVMGIIGTIHVLASHTSVGASWLFALIETKAVRENKPELMEYIKKYGVFLLVFSYIIGSITGPGIWYAITVASPKGVGGLIHNFVWVWAAEWVYFTVEVIGVYALVYLIGKIDPKTHLKLTWTFALASWATMLLIVGILSFMMWPGNESWYQTGSTLDAFFNLNFFAHLGLRTAFMFAIAGAVGGILAATMKDKEVRIEITRFLSKMGIAGVFLGLIMWMWYVQTLPENARIIMQTQLPSYIAPTLFAVLAATLIYFAWSAWKPLQLKQGFAVAMTAIIAIAGLWPEERSRESIRKPYVAGQYIYSNQTIARDVEGKQIKSNLPQIAEHGVLKTHPFTPVSLREVTETNRLQAGEFIAKVMCANCHSMENTGLRPMPQKLHGSTDVAMIKAYLGGALYNGTVPYMPRIPLPEFEQQLVAEYLASLSQPQAAMKQLTLAESR